MFSPQHKNRTTTRNRVVALAVAGALVAAVPALFSDPVAAQQQPAVGQQDVSPRVALARQVPSISLDDTPFEDTLEFLRALTGASFYVDWNRLEFAGVDRDTPVSLQLQRVPMRRVLDLVLDAISPYEPLTYYVDSGIIHITTLEEADRQTIVRVYDVRDLIFDVPDFYGPTVLDGLGGGGGGGGGFGGGGGGGGGLGGGGGGGLGGGLGGGGGGGGGLGGGGGGFGGGGGGGGFGGGGGGMGGGETRSREERAEELIELITETVRPDIWQVNGGHATIRFFNGNLVVNAPRSVHEMLGG